MHLMPNPDDPRRTELAEYMAALESGQMGWGEYLTEVDRMLRAWRNDPDRQREAAAAYARDDADAKQAARVELQAALRTGNLRERVTAAVRLGLAHVEILSRDGIPDHSREVAWSVPQPMETFAQLPPSQFVPASETMTARILNGPGARFVDVATLRRR